MFKLLNDLKQFFTINDELNLSVESKFIYKLIQYQNPKTADYLSLRILDDPDWFKEIACGVFYIDLLECELFSDFFGDFTSIYQAVFDTFMDGQYTFTNIDTYLSSFYDMSKQKIIDLRIDHKLDTYITRFLKDAFDDSGYRYEKELCDIQECLDEIIFRCKIIDFKNKSLARKFRKHYMRNSAITRMMNELGFYMYNGCFIEMNYYFINDGYSNDYFIDPEIMINGIEECRELFHVTNKKDMTALNDIFKECASQTPIKSLIDTLMIASSTNEEILI